jgi:hypothetical protein
MRNHHLGNYDMLTNQTTMPKAKIQAYGLVRDANGKPKIDGDAQDLPEPIKQLLTPEERQELGV